MLINYYSKITIYILIKFTIKINKICDLFCDKMFFKFEFFKNIVFDKNTLFINNFRLTFCYHAHIKRKLNIAFYSQIDKQIK